MRVQIGHDIAAADFQSRRVACSHRVRERIYINVKALRPHPPATIYPQHDTMACLVIVAATKVDSIRKTAGTW